MAGKVFISCGQAAPEEREVAQGVASYLSGRGFTPYVAIQTQSIDDVNSGILTQLKSSDYYLFIDFRRELVGTDTAGKPVSRGSLFTHQELAMAYALGFQNAIFLRQEGTELGGLAKFMLSNAAEFTKVSDVAEVVRRLLREKKWTPSYSRHLVVDSLNRLPFPESHYSSTKSGLGSHEYDQYTWLALVTNSRSDVLAKHVVARLVSVTNGRGQDIELPPHSRVPLTWPTVINMGDHCARFGEVSEGDLLPGESKTVEVFSVWSGRAPLGLDRHEKCSEVSIHVGHATLALGRGKHRLRCQVLAPDFPPIEFAVEVTMTGRAITTKGRLCS